MAKESLRPRRFGRPALRPVPAEGVVIGRARVDRRTKNLIPRLQPGEVAVIDHEDLDRVAAEGLILAKAGAVVNAARSSSGRYPNLGPLLLAAAGIPVVDGVGLGVLTAVREGQLLEIDGTEVRRGDEIVAKGVRHTLESLEAQLEAAKQSIGDELERFAENTLEYLRRERHLLTDSPVLPDLAVDLAGRHVLIVVRGGSDARADLAALTAYIKEIRPVMVAVDGGADVLLAGGHKPDLIVGDFDSVSDEALRVGAQLIVHAYPGGAAPGAARLEELGLEHSIFEAAGTSEDVAMLLAYEKRAELIVAVGTHASMVEFFDKGRAGMASTFLVRLKVGPILVDAKGVSRLYQSRVRTSDVVLLVMAALFAMIMMVAVAQPLHVFIKALWFTLVETWHTVVG
ncbi:MAG TPA: putative cytokinetic ring protein SteA [Acidimicrobiales bacterium]|nr:putative cytokinetic ring protein SteA [Acidimicrobiales bacterium]